MKCKMQKAECKKKHVWESWQKTRYSLVLMDVRHLEVDIDREEDGRWIAEIGELPGTLAYGSSREEAISRVEALALRVLAERIEAGEDVPAAASLFSIAG